MVFLFEALITKNVFILKVLFQNFDLYYL